MTRFKAIVIAAIIVIPFVVNADSNVEEKAKLHQEYELMEKELNRVFNSSLDKIKTNSHLSEELKAEWVEQQKVAQSAWKKFRDEDAKVIKYQFHRGEGLGIGTGMGGARSSWMKWLTEKRIDELKIRYRVE